jgi:hypothetical protein
MDREKMSVVEGLIHILAGGGILFLFASISVYTKSSLMFNYGITIAMFLIIPELCMQKMKLNKRNNGKSGLYDQK